jgi:hypothetical protein
MKPYSLLSEYHNNVHVGLTNSLLVTSLAEFLPILDIEFPSSAAFLGATFAAWKTVIVDM